MACARGQRFAVLRVAVQPRYSCEARGRRDGRLRKSVAPLRKSVTLLRKSVAPLRKSVVSERYDTNIDATTCDSANELKKRIQTFRRRLQTLGRALQTFRPGLQTFRQTRAYSGLIKNAYSAVSPGSRKSMPRLCSNVSSSSVPVAVPRHGSSATNGASLAALHTPR